MRYLILFCVMMICSVFFMSCSECEEVFYGYVSIDSNPQGVPISIDDQETDYITPIIIEKKIGEYIISVCFDDTTCPIQPATITENDTFDLFFSSVDSGSVNIVSEPEGAEILINGENTEFTTPAEIRLPIGVVEFTLKMENYLDSDSTVTITVEGEQELNFGSLVPRRYVFLEEFTNIRCMPCVNVYNAVHEVLPEYHDDVVFLEVHTDLFPMDPFHDENPIVHDTRAQYYGISTIPRLFYDGSAFGPESRTDPVAIANGLDARLLERSSLVVSGYYQHETGNDYSVRIFTDSKSSFVGDNLKLYGFIFRKEFSFDELPPGSNGISEFHNVLFDMFTAIEGFSLNISASAIDSFDYSFTIPDTIDIQDIGLSVAVQNESTKEIIQANYLDIR